RPAHRAQAGGAADAHCGTACARTRRFRCTTDSGHGMPIKQNLLDRQFTMPTPNRGWVTDITYVWTPEGWLYLAVILDLFSRRVVGWSLSVRLERGIALDALKMALEDRHPPRVCCTTRIAAASTPATIISSCWRY